jgi:hypothetical protein
LHKSTDIFAVLVYFFNHRIQYTGAGNQLS